MEQGRQYPVCRGRHGPEQGRTGESRSNYFEWADSRRCASTILNLQILRSVFADKRPVPSPYSQPNAQLRRAQRTFGATSAGSVFERREVQQKKFSFRPIRVLTTGNGTERDISIPA
jgi:hypothetical protein